MASTSQPRAPVLIIGAGLAGLVAAFELTRAGIPVVLIDQEPAANLGGQAFWSLGGIFIVDSAEQRRMGIRDSRALAMRDWFHSAAFDREREDHWPRQWARAFVDFACDGMEAYLKERGMGFLFNVGWAERGAGRAEGHGNSVPRFHLTWGVGPEVVRVFAEPVKAKAEEGLVEFKFRHVVDKLIIDEATGRAIGVRGRVLQDDDAPRGVKTNRETKGEFELFGSAVVVASGGIGGNVEAVKAAWPTDRLGPKVPEHFVVGVPAHVDGRMIGITEEAGANVVNRDRMWQYVFPLSSFLPYSVFSSFPTQSVRVCLSLTLSHTHTHTHTFDSHRSTAVIPKASKTGTASGPITASASSQRPHPSGSTPPANVSRPSSTPVQTPSPPSSTSAARATTTHGSSSTRPSSRASSPSRAPSRTRTLPTRAGGSCSRSACSGAKARCPCRRSRSTARTLSCGTIWRSWWRE